MTNRPVIVLVSLIAMALAGASPRQAISPGDRVVLASPTDVLKVETRVVASGRVHRVYSVGQVRGKWAWLEAEDVGGWAKLDRLNHFDQALERASARIRGGDASAQAYNQRGLLWADRGRTDLAGRDYSEAIRLDPQWYIPRLNRALAHRAAGRFDQAMADLNAAADLYPLDPLIYHNRALVHLDLAQPELALGSVDLALRVDPNHENARFNRAGLALALGREGASADAEAYLAMAGWYEARSPYAAILASLDHRRAGRDEQADALLATASSQIESEDWPAPILSHLRGDLALADLRSAAETPDQQAEARAYAGLALVFDDREDEARPLLSWVVEQADPTRLPHLLARSVLDRLPDAPGGSVPRSDSGLSEGAPSPDPE